MEIKGVFHFATIRAETRIGESVPRVPCFKQTGQWHRRSEGATPVGRPGRGRFHLSMSEPVGPG